MPAGNRVLYHHLASRSHWRNAASMKVARRSDLVALAIHALPRPHPFDLAAGRRAIDLGLSRTREALTRPVEDGAVHV
jgi:NTE family protein